MGTIYSKRILKPKSEEEIKRDLDKLTPLDRFCQEFAFHYSQYKYPRNYMMIYQIINKINKNNIPYTVSSAHLTKQSNPRYFIITIFIGKLNKETSIKTITISEIEYNWNNKLGIIRKSKLYKWYERYKFRKASS